MPAPVNGVEQQRRSPAVDAHWSSVISPMLQHVKKKRGERESARRGESERVLAVGGAPAAGW